MIIDTLSFADRINLHYSVKKNEIDCVASLAAKYIVAYDEDDENEEVEPDEEDAFLSPCGYLGSKTSLSVGGKFIGEFKDDEAAEKALVDWIIKNNWHPAVWMVSDHGNVHRYNLSDANHKKIEKAHNKKK